MALTWIMIKIKCSIITGKRAYANFSGNITHAEAKIDILKGTIDSLFAQINRLNKNITRKYLAANITLLINKLDAIIFVKEESTKVKELIDIVYRNYY